MVETKRMIAPVAELTEDEIKKAKQILIESECPFESLSSTFSENSVHLYTAEGIEVYAIG